MTRRPNRSGKIAFVACCAALARSALAEPPPDVPDAAFRPTRGVFLPEAVRAGGADATAVELNPGQLGLVRHADLAAVLDLSNGNTALPGRGAALLLAAPLFDGVALGAGLQHLFGGGGWRLSGYTKLQLGLGLGGRTFGFGATWGHVWGAPADGADTFDLGVTARLFSRAALGLVLEDANRPRLANTAEALARRWVAELALRPLGTDRLELGVAALRSGGDPWSRPGLRVRVGGKIGGKTGGAWRLFVDGERSPRREAAAAGTTLLSDRSDLRVTVGAMVAFDHGSLALAGRRAFVPEGAPGDGWGGSMVFHQSGERLVPSVGTAKVVHLKLRHLESDRAFLTQALGLRAMAGDAGLAAVLLEIDDLQLGLGRIEELRDLVGALRARGKRVVAYLTDPSTRDLYLAAACDRVVIHPAGVATFSGLAQTVTFYKEAMDHLGVTMDLVRIAEFKGAMEPFVMTGQSDAVKRNRNELLDDVYRRVLRAVESGRRAGPEPRPDAPEQGGVSARMAALVAHASFTPEEARAAGLVDAIVDDKEVESYLRAFLESPSIQIEATPDGAPVRRPRWPGRRVAVVLVDGTIVDGPSQDLPLGLGDTVGADTLVAALDECQRDASVRAVVLRVNSPGGSAFASDVVARAVSRLRAAGKPVVASMGDVAASGGYYISAPADAIFAEPSTTTGSIGIFGYKLDIAGLMRGLFLHTEVYRRGPHADAASPYRPWTADERVIAQKKIRHLYELFLGTVAAGRRRSGIDGPRADELGRGHVYTAAQAQTLGLVDALGGATAAVDRAAALGRIPLEADEAPELLVLPRPTTSLLKLVTGAEATADPETLAPALRSAVRPLAPYLFGPGEGVEARLPFDLNVW